MVAPLAPTRQRSIVVLLVTASRISCRSKLGCDTESMTVNISTASPSVAADVYVRCGAVFLLHAAPAESVAAAAAAANAFELEILAERPLGSVRSGAQIGEWWQKLRDEARWEFGIPQDASLNARDLVAPRWLPHLLQIVFQTDVMYLRDATCITTPPGARGQTLHFDSFDDSLTVQWPLSSGQDRGELAVCPGTIKRNNPPEGTRKCPGGRLPVVCDVDVGGACLYDGRLWHAGGPYSRIEIGDVCDVESGDACVYDSNLRDPGAALANTDNDHNARKLAFAYGKGSKRHKKASSPRRLAKKHMRQTFQAVLAEYKRGSH